MDSENKFWMGFWSLCASVLVTLIVCCTFDAYQSKQTFIKAVQAGNDPLKVTCSMGVSQNEIAMCTLIAEKK